MKKIITLLISVILLFTVFSSVSVQAYDESWGEIHIPRSYMPTVNGQKTDMIHSDYYKIYYNELFEYRYPIILKNLETNNDTEKDFSSVEMHFEDEPYVYITVVLKEKTDDTDYRTYNTDILKTVFSDDEMLYIGDTTPMSVVKLPYEKIEKLSDIKELEAVSGAFFQTASLVEMMYGEMTMGNVLVTPENNSLNAADARYVLRFAAGLEKVSVTNAKTFYFTADMDLDGHITSADARLILRTAAKFEKPIKIAFSYAVYWNDFAK